MEIVRATPKELWAVTKLALLLWPNYETQQMYEEMLACLGDDESALLIAKENGRVAGFAKVTLRRESVEGASSSPVGYLEGIFVEEACRRMRAGEALVHACERFAKEKGCRELASDCALENLRGIAFHRGMGFAEANRIVCFVKKLGRSAP